MERDGILLVTAVEGSDAWRHTGYGFVHDSEHARLTPLPPGRAVEVTFDCTLTEEFDHAGIFLAQDAEHWVKAAIEYSDHTLQAGAVVTRERSDWSVAPVPDWAGRAVTIRVSRFADALVVRARVEDEPWMLLRIAPWDATAELAAGPLCCAPTRAGLTVPFRSWRTGPADTALH